jgi:hypothetical protein
MNEGIEVAIWPGLLVLVGLLVSGCVSSDPAASNSTTRSGAPWARDLNEPPPTREPVNAAQLKADLNAARDKAGR